MTAQDHARDCAKRILLYLDTEITERRLLKLQGLLSEHMEKYTPVKEVTRIVEKRTQIYKYKTLIIPQNECDYIPVYQKNTLVVLNHVANHVCQKHGLTIDQLKRNSPMAAYSVDMTGFKRKLNKRSSLLVDARQEFCFIIKKHHPEISLLCSGLFLGYNDHSTVYYLIHNRKVKNWNPAKVTG